MVLLHTGLLHFPTVHVCSSEFTSPSTSHFNALSHFSRNDISFNSDGSLSLHLNSFKTDPYRQRCSLLIAPSGYLVCAVRAIKKVHGPSSLQLGWLLLNKIILVWPIPHQSQSHLNTSSSQTPTHSNRTLCLPQLSNRSSYNSSPGWLTFVSHSDSR